MGLEKTNNLREDQIYDILDWYKKYYPKINDSNKENTFKKFLEEITRLQNLSKHGGRRRKTQRRRKRKSGKIKRKGHKSMRRMR